MRQLPRTGPRARARIVIAAVAGGLMAAQLLAAAPAPASAAGPVAAGGTRPQAHLTQAQLRRLHHLGPPPRYRTVPGHHAMPRALTVPRQHSARPAPPPSWPGAGTATVTLPAAPAASARRGGAAKTAWAQAGTLPVQLAAVAARPGIHGAAAVPRVRVSVAGHRQSIAAGVNGVMLAVAGPGTGQLPARVQVRVSYARFATAFGGGYAARLSLFEVPACALTTPRDAACR